MPNNERFLRVLWATFASFAVKVLKALNRKDREVFAKLAKLRRNWPIIKFSLLSSVVPIMPNHLAIYRIKDDEIEILRILHGAQDWP